MSAVCKSSTITGSTPLFMAGVRAKKSFGQHFLTDLSVAEKIVDSLKTHGGYTQLLEIGPGMGVLTKLLLQNDLKPNLHLVELDRESVAYLKQKLPGTYALHQADVLKWEWEQLGDGNWGIIGNLPYNISSQIFFKVLEHKNRVTEVVAMVQREVGQRLAAGPGKKDNGILSILLQAYYDVEYLFTVPPEAFDPPPAVFSGVVRLRRNSRASLPVDEVFFKKVVKMAFSSRRKMLRNNVKPLNLPDHYTENLFFNKRAEQLGVDDFIHLVAEIEQIKKDS